MKTTTANRLKQYMSEHDMRQVDILRRCQPICHKYGVKLEKSDLSQYVSGKVNPGQDKLTVLGLALGVSEAWLMGYDVQPDRETGLPSGAFIPKFKKIPLLGVISCGLPLDTPENYDGEVSVPGDLRCDYAIRAEGDSMIGARIFDGDVVYIEQAETVDNGQIAAVMVDGEKLLKRFFRSESGVILQAENSAYAPMIFAGEEAARVRIIGRAVAFTSAVR